MLEEEREEGDMRESCDQLLGSCFLSSYHSFSDLLSFPFLPFCFVSFHLALSPLRFLSSSYCVSFQLLFALSSPLMSFPLPSSPLLALCLLSYTFLSPLLFHLMYFLISPLPLFHLIFILSSPSLPLLSFSFILISFCLSISRFLFLFR